jgi:hypothetical protein
MGTAVADPENGNVLRYRWQCRRFHSENGGYATAMGRYTHPGKRKAEICCHITLKQRDYYQTALFDREPFVEENPLCFYWTPKFIYQDMEADVQDFREMVSRDMIRLREDEVEEIRRKYALCHAYTTMLFLDGIFKEIKKLPFWKRIAGRDVKVLYGTYMEKMVEIGKEEAAAE